MAKTCSGLSTRVSSANSLCVSSSVLPEPAGALTQKLRPTDKLFTDSHSNELYRHLSRIPVPKAYINDWQQLRPKNPLIQHFSLHSIKRGAAALLWEAAARGEISAQAVKYLLKHKSDETTVGYAPNPVHVSQAFGTSLATRVTRLG